MNFNNDIKRLPPKTKTSRKIEERHFDLEGGAVATFATGVLAGVTGTTTAIGSLSLAGFAGIATGQAILSFGISFALNSLFAPSKPSFGSGNGSLESSPTYGFDNVGTSFNPVGESVPILYGEIKQGGKRIQAFTRQEKGNQFLYMLLLVGEGEIDAIENIDIDNQPIDNYDNVSISRRYGVENQNPISEFSNKVFQQSSSKTITTDWTTYSTTQAVDEFLLGTIFPAGLFEIDGGDLKSNFVGFEIQTKKQTESSYLSKSKFRSVDSTINSAWKSAVYRTGDGTSDGNVVGANEPNELWFEASNKDIIRPAFPEGSKGKVDINGSTETFTVNSIEQKDFSISLNSLPQSTVILKTNRNDLTNGDIANATNLRSQALTSTVKAKTKSAHRHNFHLEFANTAKRDIRIRRKTELETDPSLGEKAQVNFWQEIEANSFSYDNFALLGLKIKASDQLSGRAPNVNFDVRGRKALDNISPLGESGWTDNPFWCVWDLLTLPKNRGGAGIDEGKLNAYYQDWENSANFADEKVADGEGGQEKRYKFDFALDTDMRVNDFLSQVSQTINGFFLPVGDGIKPVISKENKTPKDLFTRGQGIKANTMQWEFIDSDTRYNSAKVEILDQENDYERIQIVVPRDSSLSGDERMPQADITLPGVTRRSQAFRNSLQTLVESDSERAIASWKTPLKKIHVEPGDLVWVANEEAGEGWGDVTGVIEGFTSDYLVLDQEFDFKENGTYDIVLMMNDGSLEELRVDDPTLGRKTSIVHPVEDFNDLGKDPWPQSDYAIGVVNKNKKVMRILSIEKSTGDDASVKAIEHDDTKFNKKNDFSLDDLEIDDFLTDDEPQPVRNLFLDEERNINADGDVVANIHVYWSPPDLSNISHYRILYEDNLNDDTRLWTEAGTTDSGHSSEFVIENVPEGVLQGVKVQTVMDSGAILPIGQSPQETITPLGSLARPEKVKNFRAEQEGDYVQLRWESSDFDVFSHYEIRRGPTWDEGEIIADNLTGTQYRDFDVVNSTYEYMIKAVSISGKKSKTPASEFITVNGLTDPNFAIEREERNFNWPGTKDDLFVKQEDVIQETVDNFEDGLLTEYTNNTDKFTIQNSNDAGIWNGNLSLVSSGTGSIISTSGLDNYPNTGQTYRIFTNMTNSNSQCVSYFGVQDSDEYYGIKLDNKNNNFELMKNVSGTKSTLKSVTQDFDTDQFYKQEVQWTTDNDLTVRLFNNSNTVLQEFTVTDDTYTQGGIGFENINGTNYWDFARRLIPDSTLIGGHDRTWLDLGDSSDTWNDISGSLSDGTWETGNKPQYTTNKIDIGKVWNATVRISRTVDILGSSLTWEDIGTSSQTWSDLQDDGEIFWDELDVPNDGTLEYRLSDDGSNWSPWTEYSPFEAEFRYIQVRLTVDLTTLGDEVRISSLLITADVEDITINDTVTVSGTKIIDFSDYDDVNGDPVEFLQAPDFRTQSVNNDRNVVFDVDQVTTESGVIEAYGVSDSLITAKCQFEVDGF